LQGHQSYCSHTGDDIFWLLDGSWVTGLVHVFTIIVDVSLNN
jgi:hypothetical protein